MKYEPNRYAALIHFKRGATPEQIAAALNSIKDVLAFLPEKWSDVVHKYDDRYGSPVFYIP